MTALGPTAGIALGSSLQEELPTTTLAQVVASRHNDKVFILLLTISHDDLTDDIRVTDDALTTLSTGVVGVLSNGLEYIQLPFKFVLPNIEDDSPPRSKIVVDNISRVISATLNDISSPPTIGIKIVLSSDPNTVEISLDDFILESVTFDSLTVEGDLVVEQFEQEPYPKGRFLPSGFPGLFKGSVSETSS